MVQDYLFERYNPIFGIYGLLTRATKRDKITYVYIYVYINIVYIYIHIQKVLTDICINFSIKKTIKNFFECLIFIIFRISIGKNRSSVEKFEKEFTRNIFDAAIYHTRKHYPNYITRINRIRNEFSIRLENFFRTFLRNNI